MQLTLNENRSNLWNSIFVDFSISEKRKYSSLEVENVRQATGSKLHPHHSVKEREYFMTRRFAVSHRFAAPAMAVRIGTTPMMKSYFSTEAKPVYFAILLH